MRKILTALLLLMAPNAFGAWSMVNYSSNTIQGSGNPITTTFSNALSNPSVILVCTNDNSGNSSSASCSDTAGNTYLDWGPGRLLFGGSGRAECFYALNTFTTSNNVISCSWGSGFVVYIQAYEFTGGATSSITDGNSGFVATTSPTGNDNVVSGNFTTSANGDLIVGYAALSGHSPIAIGTGFTGDIEAVASLHALEYKTQTSAGSVAATATDVWGNTFSTGQSAVAMGIALKAASGGGGNTVVNPRKVIITGD